MGAGTEAGEGAWAVIKPIVTSKWFWIVLGVLIIAYVIYKYGRNSSNTTQVGYTGGTGALPDAADWNPNVLSNALGQCLPQPGLTSGWAETFGVNDSSQNASFYNLANLPDDAMVQAVYNTFNKSSYGSNGTLTTQISSVVALTPDLLGGVGGNRDAAVARLQRANCP